MAKGGAAAAGKLTKLKSVMKKWQSFSSRLGCVPNAAAGAATSSISAGADDYDGAAISREDTENLRPVYVGKSRRRYLVSPDVVQHPLFQELVQRPSSSPPPPSSGADAGITVACEVVLFDHLLWMLQIADSQSHHSDSLDELVHFYAC